MKRITLSFAFVALFAVTTFAKTNTVKTSSAKVIALTQTGSKKVIAKEFPVTFETSCGTWTGTADCGSSSTVECGAFLNDVGDFLESLCE